MVKNMEILNFFNSNFFRLGIILGSKIFVDFKKYEFEECMRRLFLELSQYSNKETPNNEEKSLNNIGRKTMTINIQQKYQGEIFRKASKTPDQNNNCKRS
jgi:hypothetical protein